MASKVGSTRAARVIPLNELWLRTPRNRELVKRAITWAEKNPSQKTDVEPIERKLKRRR